MFEKSLDFKAINIPYNWNVDYWDGTHLSEYDEQTRIKNDFYEINKDSIARFGLFGCGSKYFYEDSDGSFNLKGKRVEIFYEVDGRQYRVGSHQKDPITYKRAYADYNNVQGPQRSNIESIHFGYKTRIENGDIKLFYQSVVALPAFTSVFIEVKLSANKDLNGDLVFKVKGKEVERYRAPLKAGKAGQINWTVKY
ncbi:hypothetical protein MKY88_24310 [Lysinibacillus sp. FSL R7-0073]|uniref:hypothetical protein n=1 Tax=Lysinibacillus TaxID=400634 RepID=UPI002E2339CB|nr:hypothetical protein [Lysinibacillus fusiformis]